MRKQSNGFENEFKSFSQSLGYLLIVGLLCFVIFMVLALFRISSFAFSSYDSLNDLPHNEVGLLLGTSSYSSDGSKNPFFVNRINAAVLLYKKGKIDYILVSGDNRHLSYNEPRQMMNALLREGVPRDRIVADFAGFSTIDSVVRASKVFMLKDVTIISQSFHNERALFIAAHEGMNAIGFNALDPTPKIAHFGVYFREIFARIKCVLDVYFLNTQPTFLGDPIQIGDSPMPKEISNTPKRRTSPPKQPTNSAFNLQEEPNLTLSSFGKEQTDAAIILRQQRVALEHLEHVVERDRQNYERQTQVPAAAEQ